jgi:hypothetical protein
MQHLFLLIPLLHLLGSPLAQPQLETPQQAIEFLIADRLAGSGWCGNSHDRDQARISRIKRIMAAPEQFAPILDRILVFPDSPPRTVDAVDDWVAAVMRPRAALELLAYLDRQHADPIIARFFSDLRHLFVQDEAMWAELQARLDGDPEFQLPGDHPAAGSWGLVSTVAQVQHQINASDVSWAQTGIRLKQIGPILVQRPTADMYSNGWFDYTSGSGPVSDDALRWINAIGPPAQPLVTPMIAEITFTGPYRNASGTAFTPGMHQSDPNPPAFAQNSYAFVGGNLPPFERVLAHELGHLLINRPDPWPHVWVPEYFFFPTQEGLPDDDPALFRRIWRADEGHARTWRDTGALGARGSQLLVDP